MNQGYIMEVYQMTIAERVADKYVAGLDMSHLAKLDIWLLHAIKSVAVRQWARAELARRKGVTL
jgi:hypothetical protein